jgi:hypothetical protein
VANASQSGAMVGPDTVDGIAPAGAWPTWWKQQVQAKRDGAPWIADAAARAELVK